MKIQIKHSHNVYQKKKKKKVFDQIALMVQNHIGSFIQKKKKKTHIGSISLKKTPTQDSNYAMTYCPKRGLL